ncbi:hypothetical protein HMPREF3227_00506 [Corynebacterium sp. CMW7794]|nr:hypothetical protein HMPREF3227_00506 [Corynebacterium sp. CMW7794]
MRHGHPFAPSRGHGAGALSVAKISRLGCIKPPRPGWAAGVNACVRN